MKLLTRVDDEAKPLGRPRVEMTDFRRVCGPALKMVVRSVEEVR